MTNFLNFATHRIKTCSVLLLKVQEHWVSCVGKNLHSFKLVSVRRCGKVVQSGFLFAMETTTRYKLVSELHSPSRLRFPRRSYVLKGIFDLIQADLLDLQYYSRENKGYKYILICINAFSKYVFAQPLKTKRGIEVACAIKKILKQSPKVKHFQTDAGAEFYNSHVKQLLSEYNINHYSTFSHIKAAICERVIRTIKSRLFFHFSLSGTRKWLPVLQEIIDNYNSTEHRTIKMKPKDVKKKHEAQILSYLNRNITQPLSLKPKFKIGDLVRISRARSVFDKGYLYNWSAELFKVISIKMTNPIVYLLQDLKGQNIQGSFYQQELKKTKLQDDELDYYLIEKVLKRNKDKLLVRWVGFPTPSWISSKDLQ